MPKNLIIYHRNCTDGHTAAWVAFNALPGSDADLHAAHYGEPPPDVEGRNVYIVDFSYPRDVLLAMKERTASLVVLDHHKTAAADLEGLDFCTFDMEESGASLTWRHFHGDKPMPKLVQYVRDRDLWRWVLPHSREVSEYIRLREFSVSEWDKLEVTLDADLASAVSIGCALRRATDKRVREAASKPVPVVIAGVDFRVTNATTDFSEVAGELAKETGAGAAYFHRKDGRVQFSLRGDERVDVAKVAAVFGGGGHTAAAGFDVSLQGFLGIMGGANERQTGNAYQWCCVRCGGGMTEYHCTDCGAGSSSACVPGWFGEGVAKQYADRWKDGHAQALRKVRDAVEADERNRRGPELWKVLNGEGKP